MKLLVPVDGSDSSINVMKKAIEIAKKYDFSIKLINVVSSDLSRRFKRSEQMWRQVDGSVISGREISLDVDDLTSKMRENSDEMLDTIIKQFDFGDVKVEKEVLFGEPHAEIIEMSEKEKFDLIVMGNRGYSDTKRFFVGSVTQRVISESKCPVLVIHSDSEE